MGRKSVGGLYGVQKTKKQQECLKNMDMLKYKGQEEPSAFGM